MVSGALTAVATGPERSQPELGGTTRSSQRSSSRGVKGQRPLQVGATTGYF